MSSQVQVIRQASGRFWVRRRPTFAWNALHIDVSDPAQIAHWCRELGCTWLELFSAIDRVGPGIGAVRNAVRSAVRR